MDDGAYEYAGLSIQTHSFSEADVNFLIEVLRTEFNIDVSKKINKERWIIYFPKRSLPKLKKIVSRFVLPEFRYKFVSYYLRKKPRRDYTPIPIKSGMR